VIAHNTEEHFGSAVPQKSHITPGGNLPHFCNHSIKCHNRFWHKIPESQTIQTWKNSMVDRTNRIFQ